MKLKDIYERAIKKAVREDPRPSEKKKGSYEDTKILFGTGREEVRTILVGIDIDVAELLLADRLREKGVDIDLVISHHPAGRAFAELAKVMRLQPDIWEAKYGFEKRIAEGLMKERKEEVSRGISPYNHMRAPDAAKLLGIPFMCLHTAADNCVTNHLQSIFDAKKPKKLGNVLNILKNIPEYKTAVKVGAGPHILVGKKNDKAGRIFVDMTGGTNGPDKVYSRLSQSGVGTVVGMHIKESGFKTIGTEFINYVVAGHMASDNLGMNLLFDAVDSRKELKFIECSGFRRFRRK